MPRFYPLTVKALTRETSECTTVTFDLPAEWEEVFQFTQGQYLTLKVEIDGEEVRRSYSLCSSPLDRALQVAVKRVPDGKFSTYVQQRLQPGDTLAVMPPMGKFFTPLDPQQRKHYVAFAAGSGITPIMSILQTVLRTEPQSEFTLLYGNQYISSVIFKEQIEGLKNRYLDRLRVFHFFSREIPDAPLFSGRLDGEKVREALGKIIDIDDIDEAFLCGPEEMIFGIKAVLSEAGLPPKQIHFELFTTGSAPKRNKAKVAAHGPSSDQVCEVQVKDGGNSFSFNLPFDTESVLDGALSRGADLPFACKGGVCCTCKAKLLEGKVEMAVNYALEPEEVEAGFILACQSFPKSRKVVVDFDEAL
jgi:ring-1,2-phenylacetyl-CoA epoxidase subunit PaaE